MSKEKRSYTMTEAALEQRRAASKLGAAAATGPKTPEGKAISSRNGWKTGEYSRISRAPEWMRLALGSKGRPCLSTCAKFPCSLVDDGLTQAGGDCLDKRVFVDAFESIIMTLQSGDHQYAHGLMASQIASAVQMLQDLRDSINDDCPAVVPKYAISKEGTVIQVDGKPVVVGYVMHPAYFEFTNLFRALGINFPELMATPKAAAKLNDQEDAADAITNLFSHVLSRAGKGPVKRGRVIEHESTEVDE